MSADPPCELRHFSAASASKALNAREAGKFREERRERSEPCLFWKSGTVKSGKATAAS